MGGFEMETVTVSKNNDYAVVRLRRGKVNPINAEMVHDLTDAFAELAEDDSVRGVILAGRDGVFSAGLDVVELYEYDAATFDLFWRGYAGLAEKLVAYPKALVAAITGHSPAGGCILALCCDYRIMAEGPYVIGLNEVAIHLALPEPIGLLLVHASGFSRAYQCVLDGLLLAPNEALKAGLVNEVCPLENVMESAVKKLRQWFQFDDNAWRRSKWAMRRTLREAFARDFDELYGEASRQWWSPAGRAAMKRLVMSLKN
jgi:enoyl-CoA hydratase/carnithine racemase